METVGYIAMFIGFGGLVGLGLWNIIQHYRNKPHMRKER